MLSITRKGTYIAGTGLPWDYYGDDSAEGVFYIIPKPQFSFDNGKPIFSLVEFKTNDAANGSGYCHFQAQLTVPGDIQQAVKQDIMQKFGVKDPQLATLNFNPNSTSQVEFTNAITPEEPRMVQVLPSLTGGNAASFLIDLDRDGMGIFRAAFSGASGAIPIWYALSVNARLPQIKATVTFNSQAAYNYEKSTKVDKNVWGDVTRREVTIRSYLSQSQAGSINIDPGDPPPPPDVMEEVDQWAKRTLENLVEDAVASVIAGMNPGSADKFNMNMISSFKQVYERSQVVDWIFGPTDTLPSMPALGFEFEDFYQIIDARQFGVNVTMNLNFSQPGDAEFDENEAIDSVDVTLTYPGLANNTFRFDSSEQSHLFATKWDTDRGGLYDLAYTVNYVKPGQPPLRFEYKNLEQSIFTITPYQAGLISVTFDGSNLDWSTSETGFKWVQVEFFFQDLSGNNKPVTQVVQLDGTIQRQTIKSIFSLPIFNPYSYQMIYLTRDSNGLPFRTKPVESNAAQVFVQDPFAETTLFLILDEGVEDRINYALLKVWYSPAAGQPSITKNYKLDAVRDFVEMPVMGIDTDSLLFHFQGTMLMNSGPSPRSIPESFTPGPDIVISADTAWFAVRVNPGLINWTDTLAQVKAEVRYEEPGPVELTAVARAITRTTADDFFTGYYYASQESPSYRWIATYSYTDKPAVEVSGTSSSPIWTLAPTPADLEYNLEDFE